MIENLNIVFKKYISIFINEYADYLSKDQLELLKDIDFNKVIKIDNDSKPFGMAYLGQIHLSNTATTLIDNLKNMPGYNTLHYDLENKNLSSYIKYMCDNGYSINDYYSDILMYFIFWMVTKTSNGLINGLINQEIKYLGIKYSIRLANLYSREEAVISKITPLLGMESCRKIIFMDEANAFKYLNDNHGFRVAKLVSDVSGIIDSENEFIHKKEYSGYNGFLNYVSDYDHIGYGDAYNYILDYEVEKSMTP